VRSDYPTLRKKSAKDGAPVDWWSGLSPKSAFPSSLEKLPRTSHYQTRLPQSAALLLKNHSLFLQNSYALQQAAILRGTFSSILSGEGFDEVERGELPFVFWRYFGCPYLWLRSPEATCRLNSAD
jgi:hypothetical protein